MTTPERLRPEDRPPSPPLWTAEEIAAISGVPPVRGPRTGWHVTDVCVTPDEAGPGALVLTTRAAHWGRTFTDTSSRLRELVASGASAIITDTAPNDLVVPADVPVFSVENTRKTLDALGAAARSRFAGRLIAVAGGHPSATTPALADLLSRQAATCVSLIDANGTPGVARNLARTPPDDAFAIHEVGTRRAARLVRPHVLIVPPPPQEPADRTGAAGTTTRLARVLEGLEPECTVVFNREGRAGGHLMLSALEQGLTNVVTFGTSESCDVRLVDVDFRANTSRVRATVRGCPITYTVHATRRPPILMTLGALAAVQAVGGDWKAAAEAMADLLRPPCRARFLRSASAPPPPTDIPAAGKAGGSRRAASAPPAGRTAPERSGHVGFMCNINPSTSPMTMLTPAVLNRAIMIDERLRESGLRLFLYSPKFVTADQPEVPGYLIADRDFVPTTAPVPRVNANWTAKSRQLIDKGMGYKKFLSWTRRHEVRIYVPYEFSDLVSNKLRTYRVVSGFSRSLHPHTERYDHSAAVLESFVQRGDAVFLKPRSGNMGNGIVVLRRTRRGFSLVHHMRGERTRLEVASLEEAARAVRRIAAERRYVIQQGIDTLRLDGSAFDVRVIMVHDGSSWHWIHETRMGAPDGELSNVNQGGRSLETSVALGGLLGEVEARRVMDELCRTSHELAAFLESLYPDGLMEIAFDFLVDRSRDIHLGEINTKPGLALIEPESTVFDRRPDEEDLYERYIAPHMTWMARFLRMRVECRAERAA